MIKNLYIDNFKLFGKGFKVPLNSLNLLTGANGRGKSSVLQVFLLMSQSVLKNRATNKIYLNGDNVKLGNYRDIKNNSIQSAEGVHFGFDYSDFRIDYHLSSESNDSDLLISKINFYYDNILYTLEIDKYLYTLIQGNNKAQREYPLFDLFLSDSSLKNYEGMNDLTIALSKVNINKVHYISADRIGPQNYYENKTLDHFISVGALGENTVNLLHHIGSKKVEQKTLEGYSLIFNENIDDLGTTIFDNTNLWMDKIFQGAQIKIEPIPGEDFLKLRINSDGKAPYYKPTNVGYGFSYSLPIIVAGLIAKRGEILIVENPEAHLHPYAQSVIAKFLSLISSTGVQVLVESHSDHILNGIRIAVKDNIVDNNDVNVLYFDDFNGELFKKIDIDKDGGIDEWPAFFFDQAVDDLNYLLGI